MPLYRFNVFGRDVSLDTEGSECIDVTQAQREAIRYVGALLCEAHSSEDFKDGWRMEMLDESGRVIMEIALSISTVR